MPRRSPSPRTILGLATLVLLLTSLAPTRYTGWFTSFRGAFMALVTPASGPVTTLSSWLRPSAEFDRFGGSSEAELERQVRELEVRLLRSYERVESLEVLIRDIQRGTAYEQPVTTRKVEATRVSANLPAGTFDVNRGRRHGVIGGTVAVARGSEQLVGIVTSAGPLVSTVHVISDRRLDPSLMVGVVMSEGLKDEALTAEGFGVLPRAQFRPTREGTLVAEAVGADEASRIRPGDLVRLADETWPSAAQMLVLGRVTRRAQTDDPLFFRVTIEPLADLARLRSIILFIPEDGIPMGGDGR